MYKTSAIFFLVIALAGTLLAEKYSFDRYQSLVDRQMFGPLPPGFDPNKLPSEVKGGGGKGADKELTKEQEAIKKSVKFSVIDVRPDGTVRVGFTDMDAKDSSGKASPKSYFLAVGESSNGWLVKEADPDEATMVIEKEGIELELSLGGESKVTANKHDDAVPASAGGARARGLLNSGGGMSLRARREQRRKQDEAEREQRKQEAAELAAEREQRKQEAAERAAEREEQRRQLQAIQEELKQARETREAEKKEAEDGEDASE